MRYVALFMLYLPETLSTRSLISFNAGVKGDAEMRVNALRS